MPPTFVFQLSGEALGVEIKEEKHYFNETAGAGETFPEKYCQGRKIITL